MQVLDKRISYRIYPRAKSCQFQKILWKMISCDCAVIIVAKKHQVRNFVSAAVVFDSGFFSGDASGAQAPLDFSEFQTESPNFWKILISFGLERVWASLNWNYYQSHCFVQSGGVKIEFDTNEMS